MRLKNFFQLLCLLVIMSSCEAEDDNIIDPKPTGAYSEGIFILNEGNFGQGNSTVSFLDPQSGEVTHSIFSHSNGSNLGDTATDIGFYGELAFIVVNVSNTIQVVNRATFTTVATITQDLKNPRKIAFLKGKAYVTNWGEGSNPDDDFIAVFNAETFELITKLAVEEGPEDILAQGERIFVAHLGGWNFNNVVSVISGTEVVKNIEVGEGPNALAAGNDFLWVSSSGMPDYLGETAGSIHKINLSNLEVVQEFQFQDAQQHPNHLSLENGTLYYTLGNDVYSFASSESTLPATAKFSMDEVEYLYGISVKDGKIYAASADPGFTGDGNLYVYNSSTGSFSAAYDTGINPNGVFFP